MTTTIQQTYKNELVSQNETLTFVNPKTNKLAPNVFTRTLSVSTITDHLPEDYFYNSDIESPSTSDFDPILGSDPLSITRITNFRKDKTFKNMFKYFNARVQPSRRKNDNAKAQGAFDFDVTVPVSTQVIIEDSIEQLGDITNTLCTSIDAFGISVETIALSGSEKSSLLKSLSSMSTSLRTLSKTDIPSEVKDVIDTLKDEFLPSDGTRSFGAFAVFTAAAAYHYHSRTWTSSIILALSLGAILTFTDIMSKSGTYLVTFATFIISLFAVKADSDNPKAEITDTQFDGFITSLSTIYSGYIATSSGKPIPLEWMKNLGTFSRAKSSIVDFLKFFVQGIEIVVNFIKVDALGGTPLKFFELHSDVLEKYVEAVKEIVTQVQEGSFLTELDNGPVLDHLIVQGERLLQKISNEKALAGDKTALSVQINRLNKLRENFIAIHGGTHGSRQEPATVLFKGGPGTGKSVAMEQLSHDVCLRTLGGIRLNNFTNLPSREIHNRVHENKFWDGYSNQWVTTFDDFAQSIDVAGQPDNEFMNVLRACQGFEYVLHMAHLDQKGRTVFDSKFVLLTTNAIHFHACNSLLSHDALMRRFDLMYVVYPKLEFTTTETSKMALFSRKLDNSKLIQTPVSTALPNGEVVVQDVPDLNVNCLLFQRVDVNHINIGLPVEYNDVLNATIDIYTVKRGRFELFQQKVKARNETLPVFVNVKSESSFFDRLKVKETRFTLSQMKSLDLFEDDIREAINSFMSRYVQTSGMIRSIMDSMFSRLSCDVYGTNYVVIYTFDIFLGVLLGDLRSDVLPLFCPEFILEKPELKGTPFEAGPEFDFMMSVAKDIGAKYSSYRLSHKFVLPLCKDYEVPDFTTFNLSIKDKIKNFYLQCINSDIILSISCFLEKQDKWFLIVSGLTLFFGSLMISGWLSSFFSKDNHRKAKSQSFGHSDRMAKTSRTKFYNKVYDQFQPAVKSQAGSSIDANGELIVDSILKSNHFDFYVQTSLDDDKFSCLGAITFVKGTVAIMPFHFVMKLIMQTDNDPDYMDAKVKVSKENGVERSFFIRDVINGYYMDVASDLGENDLCLVQFPVTMQICKDIISKFAKKDDVPKHIHNIPFIMPMRKGTRQGFARAVDRELPVDMELNFNKVIDNENPTSLTYYVRDSYAYDSFTTYGDCGSLFCVMNPLASERKIFGIHVAGGGKNQNSYAAAVTQESILKDLKHFQDVFDSEPVDKFVTGESGVIFGNKQFNTLGTALSPPSSNFKTSIKRSRCYGDVCMPLTAPAVLRPITVNDVLMNPLYLAQSKYCPPPVWIKKSKIDAVLDDYFAWNEHVSRRDVDRRVHTVDEALFGLLDESESRGLASNTSAGYPMTSGVADNLKKILFATQPDTPERAFATELIRNEVNILLEDYYLKGIRPLFVFTDFLKDERRSLEKVRLCVTRFVSGAPFLYLSTFKMYFGAFALHYQKNRIDNGSSVGVNPYSSEWDVIAKHLTRYDRESDSHVGAGDYSAFDGSEVPIIHYAILDYVNRWYDDGPVNSKIRHLLWQEVVNSRHIAEGVLYEWFSSLPSGHPGTIWINCMYNHFAFRLTWLRIFETVRGYNENVYVIVCGDDNTFTVNHPYRSKFNELTLGPVMKEIGLTYTTELKVTAVVPFRRLEDIEFLKRSFRKEHRLGLWLAPLRLSVILEMPNWTKKHDSDGILASNINEALRELSLHSKPVFDMWSPLIIDVFKKHYPAIMPVKPLLLPYTTIQDDVCASLEYY